MAKAKPTKHTAKELAQKAKDSTVNRGGGKAGQQDRLGGKAGHAKFTCNICGMAAPDPKSMAQHFESKHPKLTYDESLCTNAHAAHGGTTQGVAVRGSTKK